MTGRRLFWDRRGSAAVEMAIIAPMLVLLMFSSVEMGNYFLNQHIVAKAVRDGARYAARLPMTNYSCSTVSGTAEADIQNVTRTGTVDGSGTGRLGYWQAQEAGTDTVTVTVDCDTSGTYSGIYDGLAMGGVPRVTVSADVPYPSLFGLFGLLTSRTFKLRASSQIPVMGT